MPEWLVERGIGETRAVLIEHGEIIEGRVELDGTTPAGTVIEARLMSIGINHRNAVAADESGVEYLLPRGAAGVTQGAKLRIAISREAIPGHEPWKRPLARLTDEEPKGVRSLAERLAARELVFPNLDDELERSGWSDLLEQARTGIVGFAGGELRISPTPAMTLIDVDGYLVPDELAILGAREAARAIRRLDIGGSIGIDLPTSKGKTARQSAAKRIDATLAQPFERTAVNGFGFVQIVRPRSRASLIELAQAHAPFEARTLLRRAALEHAGPKRLVAHSAVVAAIEVQPQWLEALSRQVGGPVSLRADPNLPMSGGYAETA